MRTPFQVLAVVDWEKQKKTMNFGSDAWALAARALHFFLMTVVVTAAVTGDSGTCESGAGDSGAGDSGDSDIASG
jgi:hypothetical protein